MKMIDTGGKNRWRRIVGAVRIVHGRQDEQELIAEMASVPDVFVLCFINAYGMNSIINDAEYFDSLLEADIILRDGSGMAILYFCSGRAAGLNMNGTDLIPKILAAFHGQRVALWGPEEPYLGAAARYCETELGVSVVSRENGFYEIDFYRRLAVSTQPNLILLGMGIPKQEILARALRSTAGLSSLIVCGGAIIDFLGGKEPRAPEWMRRLGIEWLHRLAREPRRLFNRYVIGNPIFLWRVLTWLNVGR